MWEAQHIEMTLIVQSGWESKIDRSLELIKARDLSNIDSDSNRLLSMFTGFNRKKTTLTQCGTNVATNNKRVTELAHPGLKVDKTIVNRIRTEAWKICRKMFMGKFKLLKPFQRLWKQEKDNHSEFLCMIT